MKPGTMFGRLEGGEIQPGRFGHFEHLEAAWDVLAEEPFLRAAVRYATAIERFATAAGAPGKFNLTVTLAFLSLVAERMSGGEARSFDRFIALNPDLLGDGLAPYYSPERLRDPIARHVFLLPDVLPGRLNPANPRQDQAQARGRAP
jgi:hypothetical protein